MPREIELSYYGADFDVTICLKNKSENNEERTILKSKDEADCFWQGNELETPIDNAVFNKMYDILFNIDIKTAVFGNQRDDDIDDGANIHLYFGGDSNQIHFELWGVSKRNMEQRNITDLCAVVKELLELAGINKKEFEDDL
jgi:hypothetical protein